MGRDPATSTAAKSSPVSEKAVSQNVKNLEYIHSFTSVLAAFTAGIIGLTAHRGLLFYAAVIIVELSLVVVLKARSKPSIYFKAGLRDILTSPGYFNAFFSYIMFWTLGYGLVHIY